MITENQDLHPDLITHFSSELCTPIPSKQRKMDLFQRIQTQIDTAPPQGSSTLRQREGEWVSMLPLIDIKVLHIDAVKKTQTAIWRLQPGAVIPSHAHAHDEECLMLEGEAHVGDHLICSGDFHLVKAGFKHPEITSKTGAMVLVRGELMDDLAA